ncbi:MAG TPA: MFS transporter [Polyangiaceae bacterium]|nr:MFS transporter [Polyangiaceae bacterium]
MLEGALHAVMVGVAESYLGAFAVELGHGPRHLALLSTLPLLAGASIQLLAPMLCALLGGRKRLVVAGALGQTASLAALLAIAASGSTSLTALLAAQLGFWTSGGAMAPGWNAWMASLTVYTERPRYFAQRSGLNQLALLIAFGAAGCALHHAGASVLRCFVILFAVAFVARLASVAALLGQADLEPPRRVRLSEAQVAPRARKAWLESKFQVATYLCALAFGTHLAAPFFTPYMLRELSLDYKAFAALSATSILAKALAFCFCHRIAKRTGLERLLAWGGAGVALTPLVWACSSDLGVLIFAHVLGGMVWAAVEYTSYQLLLDNAPADLTAEFFSISNCMTGLAQLAGALAGGLMLSQGVASYHELFLLSALVRALPLVVLLCSRRGQTLPLRELYARFAALRAPGATRPLLVASELPRTLGDRTTHPPPAL